MGIYQGFFSTFSAMQAFVRQHNVNLIIINAQYLEKERKYCLFYDLKVKI